MRASTAWVGASCCPCRRTRLGILRPLRQCRRARWRNSAAKSSSIPAFGFRPILVCELSQSVACLQFARRRHGAARRPTPGSDSPCAGAFAAIPRTHAAIHAALYLDHGEDREDQGPAGGFMLDGRADSLHAQALFHGSTLPRWAIKARISAQRLRRAPYALRLAQFFGEDSSTTAAIVAAAALAVERFEVEDRAFIPIAAATTLSCRPARLSAQQLHGLASIRDRARAIAPMSSEYSPGAGARGPAFTDYAIAHSACRVIPG